MPQYPPYTALNPSNQGAPFRVDAGGGLVLSEGGSSHLDITAATVVKAKAGVVMTVAVLVAGSAVGTVNDCLTTGAAAVANQVYTIPDTIGNYTVRFPCLTGIVVVPGTGQTLAVSFN